MVLRKPTWIFRSFSHFFLFKLVFSFFCSVLFLHSHTPHTSTHLSFRILCFPGKNHKVYSSICSQHACRAPATTCHVSLSPVFPSRTTAYLSLDFWRLCVTLLPTFPVHFLLHLQCGFCIHGGKLLVDGELAALKYSSGGHRIRTWLPSKGVLFLIAAAIFFGSGLFDLWHCLI